MSKKLVSTLLAALLVLIMAVPVMAEDSYTITVASTDTHSYDVYQIFTGDYSDGILSNVKWGINGTGTTGESVDDTILEALAAVKDSTDNATKLAVINQYVDLTSTKVATVDKSTGYEAATGYYLIKDVSSFTPAVDEYGNETETYTQYIVQIIGDVEITRKADTVPGTEKKIIEDSSEVTVNEVNIGDTVTYKITTKVPETADQYDFYYFIINDTLDAGLTFQPNTTTVTDNLVVTAGSETLKADADYCLYTDADAEPYTFRIALLDAKSLAGEDIVVTCKALVNDEATVNKIPNKNTESVTYSNNPNFEYDGTNIGGKPGLPDSTKNVPTGETTDQVVESYSTTVTVYKVDENGDVLTGAEFTLTGDTNKVRVSTSTTFMEATDGTYYKLNNGTYTTEAPEEPKMEAAASGATNGYVIAEDDFTGTFITVGGVNYRVVNEGETPNYILNEGNAGEYSSTSTKYKKTVTTTTMTDGTDTDIKGEVAADGTVIFEGLGVGKYTLTETKTPAGYNTIDPIEFEIKFDASTKTFSSKDLDENDNGLEIPIKNESGTVLPTTGGIGTTIFYIAGAVLLVGAAVLLLTKKRMGAND